EFGGPGAKDAKGRSVLKPLVRVETKVKPVRLAAVLLAVVFVFSVAFMLCGREKKKSLFTLAIGAAFIAPPIVLSGYAFLRNQELEPYRGAALAVRVLICAAVYAGLWAAIWALKHYLVGDAASPEIVQKVFMIAPPIVIGALTSL